MLCCEELLRHTNGEAWTFWWGRDAGVDGWTWWSKSPPVAWPPLEQEEEAGEGGDSVEGAADVRERLCRREQRGREGVPSTQPPSPGMASRGRRGWMQGTVGVAEGGVRVWRMEAERRKRKRGRRRCRIHPQAPAAEWGRRRTYSKEVGARGAQRWQLARLPAPPAPAPSAASATVPGRRHLRAMRASIGAIPSPICLHLRAWCGRAGRVVGAVEKEKERRLGP